MVNNFRYSATGYALTKSFEGCRLVAYQDVAGVWTIGWGHTGRLAFQGSVITQAQADSILMADMMLSIVAVNQLVTHPIVQCQFDALVDFDYNEGIGHLEQSTLLKDVNAGNFTATYSQFPLWTLAGGKPNEGLLRRRLAEQRMFIGITS